MNLEHQLLTVIGNFSSVRALVVGDIMLDIYDFCSFDKSKAIDYEVPGRRAYYGDVPQERLGGAANVAANVACLGASVSLIGLVGADAACETIANLSSGIGIEDHIFRDVTRFTTTKTRLYVDGDYVLRRDRESNGQISSQASKQIMAKFMDECGKASVVILSDYDKGVLSYACSQEMIQECNRQEVVSVVDFKPQNRCHFKDAHVIAPNQTEAVAILPEFSLDDLQSHVVRLHEILECKNTVVTLGADGVCGFDGDSFFHAEGHAVEVKNAVGCGDTIRACLALGLACGLSLAWATRLANAAAAIIVGKPVTAHVSLGELSDFVGSIR